MVWTRLEAYRLDILLTRDTDPRTGRIRSGFETVEEAQAEDITRAQGLRQTAEALRPTPKPLTGRPTIGAHRLGIDRDAAIDLANRLQARVETGSPEPTLASSVFMRDARLKLGGAILQLIENNPNKDIALFTIIHPSWAFPAHWLMDIDARQIKSQFRTHLNRANVTSATGLLFGYLHGEFEPVSKEFQLHFHGVCAGDKFKAFNNLRNKQGYVRTSTIYRPIVINEIKDTPRQVSYLMQSFWPQKARTLSGRRQRDGQRIQDPYQSLYLLWLDKWKLSDLCELNGIRLQGGQMIPN